MPLLRTLLVAVLAALAAAAAAAAQAPAGPPGPVRVIELTGGVDPVSAAFVGRRIRAAQEAGASAVVIRIDTPGGLVSSMRDIVADMRDAAVPVTVWIGPSGARAGSAGAYISAASDELGMAPGTNIGAATPVSAGGGDLGDKVRNDAAASIAALAEEHGRDPAAFRAMVTDALSLTAAEARRRGVAETIQPTIEDFAAWLDGRPGRDGRAIRTAGAPIEVDGMPWYLRLLQVLTDPTLVFLLLLLGLAGVGFEVFHPGAIVPGVVGGVSLVLSLAGLSVLPFAWAGIALVLLGVAFLVAETQVGGFGVLAAGGVLALALGGAFLFDSDDPGLRPSPWAVVPIAVVVGGGFAVAAHLVMRARRRPPATGGDELVGEYGVAREPLGPSGGHVTVNGEIWNARTADGTTIAEGERVRIVRVRREDLTLTVEPGEG
ncbi:MAG: nodulation protein NfeD [Thermoleophilia bacterium]